MLNPEIMSKIKPGATVRVLEKVSAEGGSASRGKGGDKTRFTRFEGLVIARKHGSEPGATFTVRATVAGVGMEKIFPLHSPVIEKVDILFSPKKVHRAKLYYVRDMSKRRIREKLATE